ncbi:hypothetical protein PRK78_003322 [Emydomyces testavorans]|uniref:Uncharacterized protein n=1 Tax=Emydomyces testavorans TaxID=2070801 RepID=A0AAF0DFZ6_9EURO|nr:hypothetical protein PRK78_003322 [Emydomyces testavorans]
MNFFTWWTKFRDDLHRPNERTHDMLRRISSTPPEFWSPKDRMESRRQRFLRQRALERAAKRGQSMARVKWNYPEGKYWPMTPRFDQSFLDDVYEERWQREVIKSIEAAGCIFWGRDEDGRMIILDPESEVLFYWE